MLVKKAQTQMNLLPANGSPFLVLWYLFLFFLGTVLVAQIIFNLMAKHIARRIARLEKPIVSDKDTKKNKKEAK
jgi:hypothetical protein